MNGITYCYIHIPKNCGKYIKQELRKQYTYYKISKEIDDNHFLHFSYKEIIFHSYLLRNFNLSHMQYITFTRNPYDRFISGYFYLLNITHHRDEIFKRPHISINKMKNMQEYINQIINKFQRFIKEKLFYSDNLLVFKKQTDFILNMYGEIPTNLTIYKLESYNKFDINFTFENFDLPKYNYFEYYDNECLSIINDFYKTDFELLGYKIITCI